MPTRARTPEELEALLEDAFVLRDREAVLQLFDPAAVLITADGAPDIRGGEQIARVASLLWGHNRTYLADPRCVVQTRGTALVLSQQAINVLRRNSDGTWRFVICCLNLRTGTGWPAPTRNKAPRSDRA